MPMTAKLAEYASTLDLEGLRAAIKPGVSLDGLLIAAASAHDPDSRAQRRDPSADPPWRECERDRQERRHSAPPGSPVSISDRCESAAGERCGPERGRPQDEVVAAASRRDQHGRAATAGKSKEVEEIVGLLLAHGADRSSVNKSGKTPRDYVRSPRIDRLLAGD